METGLELSPSTLYILEDDPIVLNQISPTEELL